MMVIELIPSRDYKVLSVLKALKESRVSTVSRAQVDCRVLQYVLDQLVVITALTRYRAHKVQLVLQVLKVSKESRVSVVFQDLRYECILTY